MTKSRAAWRNVLESYPCATCGAMPGESCITSTGRSTDQPHAARGRATNRCARCGLMIDAAVDDPGALCGKCMLLRDLEIERATKYRRRY